MLQHCKERPETVALVIPRLDKYDKLIDEEIVTFGEFEQRINQFQQKLRAEGFCQGDRFVLMFPVSVDFYALVLALFASGMVAVLVDPGMGKKQILRAITETGAKALVTVRAVARLRWLVPRLWRLRIFVAENFRRSGSIAAPPRQTSGLSDTEPTIVALNRNDHALITFTSGTGGTPKGVDRTHGFLRAQHEALAAQFPHTLEDVDCTCFPAMALHGLCCGTTTVIPAVNMRAPASVDPGPVIKQLIRHGVTRLSGAPAFISAIARYINERAIQLKGVQKLAVGGATVPDSVCREVVRAFPGAEANVVYGSTEAEPMTSITMEEILAENNESEGYLVGRCADTIAIEIVDLPKSPPLLDERGVKPFKVTPGTPGEIIVCGPQVNRSYLNNPEANRQNKLFAPGGVVWHRTGDVGRFDKANRLWLLGRVKDVLDIGKNRVYPFIVERRIDALAGVRRSALIQTGPEKPSILAIELERGIAGQDVEPDVRSCLDHLGLPGVSVRVTDEMPVDRRHNSKIDRIALRNTLA